MITIDKQYNRIEVTGHAGYADYGQDIVCSAVSALVQTLIWSLEDLTQDKIEYVVDTGNTVITYKEPSEEAQLLIDSFFIGCEAVAENYPEYVRVTNT